jgi:hypothetical protein
MTSDAQRPSRSRSLLRTGALGLLAGFGLAPVPAAFAAPDEGGAESHAQRIFDPAFYEAFSPQSALDMVAQTPGFAIRESGGGRGMGQGSANVLIDSRRVPSKTISAHEALGRIAADRVIRIEIVDGARLDIPGLSGQVVNVITRPAGTTGRWEWNPEVQEGRKPRLARGRAIVSGAAAGWKYSLSLSSYQHGGGSAGPERVTAPSGAIVETRAEDESWNGRRHELSTAFTNESAAGAIANLGFIVTASEDDNREFSLRSGPATPDYLRTYRSANESTSGKLSGDYEFGFGPGRLKLIGLRQMSGSDPLSTTLAERIAAITPPDGARVHIDRESGESILRGEYAWIDRASNDWQMTLEGAINTLDTATTYATLANGDYIDEALAGGTTHVEEKRTEAAIVHGRNVGEGVFMQASLAAEYSQLSQTGPTGQVREFVRPKGFLSLSWAPAEDWTASFRIERAVGQLDFGDFVSSVNLNNETSQQQSGNPEIVPEQSWDIALEANGDLGRLGPVRLRLYGRQIEDVNTSLLFSRTVAEDGTISIIDGPGNADEAVTYGLDVSGTLPTNDIGIPGGKLDWTASLGDSHIDDAVTGLERPLGGSRISRYEVHFRQDLAGTPWAWGVGYETSLNARSYAITQLSHRVDSPGRVGAFIQNKDVNGLKASLSVSNLLDTEENYYRVDYAGASTDPIDFIEQRVRKQGINVGFNLSGSF